MLTKAGARCLAFELAGTRDSGLEVLAPCEKSSFRMNGIVYHGSAFPSTQAVSRWFEGWMEAPSVNNGADMLRDLLDQLSLTRRISDER